jgi:hypothetical protein
MADIENKINKEWITKALGDVNFSMEEKIDDSLLDEDVVILLQGQNMFGDTIYSYVKLTLRNFRRMREDMGIGKNFKPSDYGEVVAAGRGDPSPEVREEMRIKYKMVEVPKPQSASPAQYLSQPKFFGADEDDA